MRISRQCLYLYTPGQSRASDSVDSVGYRQTGGHLLPRIPAAFPWAHIVQSWAAERGGLWRLQCGMCRLQDTGYQYWYWSIHTPGHSLIKHCLWAKWGITNTIQLQCQVQLWMAMAINVCDISTYIYLPILQQWHCSELSANIEHNSFYLLFAQIWWTGSGVI